MKFLLLLFLSLPAFAGAVDLVGAEDRDLKITVQELRGVKPRTKNNQYVKVTVERGTKNFEIFCGRRGKVVAQLTENYLDCSDYAETVSNDDDESFEFRISMVTNEDGETSISAEKIAYVGDGTIYGDKVEILTGLEWSDHKIDNLLIGLHPAHIRTIPAFGRGEAMIKSLKPLLGRKIEVRDGRVRVELPIERLTFNISEALTVAVSASLDTSEFQNIRFPNSPTTEVSLLKSAGDLDSGFRSITSVRDEVSASLKVR